VVTEMEPETGKIPAIRGNRRPSQIFASGPAELSGLPVNEPHVKDRDLQHPVQPMQKSHAVRSGAAL